MHFSTFYRKYSQIKLLLNFDKESEKVVALMETKQPVLFRINETQNASEFLDNLKEEIDDISTAKVYTQSTDTGKRDTCNQLTDTQPSTMSAYALLALNNQLCLQNKNQESINIQVDYNLLTQFVEKMQNELEESMREIKSLEQQQLEIEEKSELYTKIVESIALLYLIVQLGAVINLTYEMGWDLMGKHC